ncbi:MAG: helix-turn-helix domain-containing protein [Candidatus Binataceae bacterium]
MRAELFNLDLRELRKALGRSQEEIAGAMRKAQSEVSRLERRDDWYLSTLREYVHALGGELEIVANFGKRRVRLRGAS